MIVVWGASPEDLETRKLEGNRLSDEALAPEPCGKATGSQVDRALEVLRNFQDASEDI